MGLGLDFRLNWEYTGKERAAAGLGPRRGSEILFRQAFGNLRQGMMDWTRAFAAIAEDILEPLVEEKFEKEGKVSGLLSWQDLAPSTREHRKDTTLLYVTGALSKSFRKGGAKHVEEIGPQKLRWGSDVPYAMFHQTGTGKGYQRGRVPVGPDTGRGMAMRRIIELTEDIRTRMRRSMTGRIAQVGRQIGFRVVSPSERKGLGPGEARRIGYIAMGLRP